MKYTALTATLLLLAISTASADPILHYIQYNVDDPEYVRPVDMDGDGDVDVVCYSDGVDSLMWLENVGTELFARHDIDTLSYISEVRVMDVDENGLMDIIVNDVYFDKIYLFQNTESGFNRITIYSENGYLSGIDTVDVNDDGRMDLVVVEEYAETAYWLDFLPGGTIEWHTIGESTRFDDWVSAVVRGDFDDDGTDDLFFSGYYGGIVAWNNGSSWELEYTGFSGSQGIDVCDMDNDGDDDIVTVDTYYHDQLYWAELGRNEYTLHEIYPWSSSPYSVVVYDINRDGLNDILATYSNFVYGFLNTGDDDYQVQTLWYVYQNGPFRSIYPAHMNDDDKLDFVGALQGSGNAIIWIENDLTPDLIEVSIQPPYDPPIIIPADGLTIPYDLRISTHGLPQQAALNLAATCRLPNGYRMPVWYRQVPFEPYDQRFVQDLNLDVPAMAPSGEYEFKVAVSHWSQGVIAYDTMPMFKLNGPPDPDYRGAGITHAGELTALGIPLSQSEPVIAAAASVSSELTLSLQPNPANASTTLHLSLPERGALSLRVYNVMGREVWRLPERDYAPGVHAISLDASELASGLYFVRAQVGVETATAKLMIVK